jgi:hypothetical protein
MANIFWRNLTSDNDANDINNYATTEGGSTVPGGTLADHAIYFSNTATSANWTLSANLNCVQISTSTDETGGTNDYTGTINYSNYKLETSGTMKFKSCTVVNSATSELTHRGLTFVAGSTFTSAQLAKINSYGNYTVGNATIWTAPFQGRNYFRENLTASIPALNNRLNEIEVVAGKTVTIDNSVFPNHSFNASASYIYGTIALGTSTTVIGNPAHIYVNGDITGSGVITHVGGNWATFNRLTPLSFTGYMDIGVYSTTYTFVLRNFENMSAINCNFHQATATITGTLAGELHCKDFNIASKNATITTINMTVISNPVFDIYGNVNFKNDTLTYTLNYVKDGETWNLCGTSKTCNFIGKELNKLAIQCSAASYTDTGGFHADTLVNNGSFTLNPAKTYSCVNPSGNGIYRSTGATVYVQYSGSFNFTGTLDNVVFVKTIRDSWQDMSLNLDLDLII